MLEAKALDQIHPIPLPLRRRDRGALQTSDSSLVQSDHLTLTMKTLPTKPSAVKPETRSDITELLGEWREGDASALERLIPQVMEQLRQLAAAHFRKERRGHTLQPTALVNEVYLRLSDQMRARFDNRTHFFAFASALMRRILVDHYRARRTAKRGADEQPVALDEALGLPALRDDELLALDEALSDLERLDARQSKVVELRFFGGLSVPETAEVLDISAATVKREFASAKAFLLHEIRRS